MQDDEEDAADRGEAEKRPQELADKGAEGDEHLLDRDEGTRARTRSLAAVSQQVSLAQQARLIHAKLLKEI